MDVNRKDTALSCKIANMSAICAFMVCIIHTGLFRGDITPSAKAFHLLVASGFCKVAVPFFFCCSGYLLAAHCDQKGWWYAEVRKRVKTLLVPLLVWSIVMWLWNAGYDIIANIITHRPVMKGVPLSFACLSRVLALDPFSQPYHGLMWYVRCLFILVLLSGTIKRFIGLPIVLALWVLYGINHPDYDYEMNHVQFFFQEGFFSLFGATYFILGMYLRLTKRTLEIGRRKASLMLLIAFILLVMRIVISVYGLQGGSYCVWLAIPFMLIGVWGVCPSSRWPSWIVGNAFPIYAMHLFVLTGIGRVSSLSKLNIYPVSSVLNYILLAVVSWGGALCLAIILRKIMPSTARVLFGAR